MARLYRTVSYPVGKTVSMGDMGSAADVMGHIYQQSTAINQRLDYKEEHEVMDFDEAVARTMTFEGGGKVHMTAGDPGGLTKWGISARAFPGVDIANLSEEQAKFLYRNNYWDKVNADKLPDVLASHVFDAAVNMGPNKAARLLQRSINLIATTRGGPGVQVDGGIGPETLKAVAAYKPDQLATIFRHLRSTEYVRLAVEGGKGKFLFGWLNRT